MLPDAALLLLMKAAPFVTDVVEMSIAVFLFLGRWSALERGGRRGVGRRATALHLGLFGAIALHVGIMVAPPPKCVRLAAVPPCSSPPRARAL